MRYIFVTGGVVSSLGKGLTAASMGALLEAWGLRVALKKFDPYLNVDPGTMNPFQHGEVYVLADGAETDLDLGHYERFTNAKLTADSSTSSGKVYAAVLKRERKGEYLGQTVQVIPHVTDEIKKRMHAADKNVDVTIIELGGTVGDIESMPFLEAIRQFVLDEKKSNVLFAHVALLPYLRVADEIKTKPAQQSVALLRGIGIQPDLLLCRTEKRITDEIRRKLSLFCNVPVEGVIQELDVQSIYEVPNMLHEEGVDRFILNYFGFAQQHCNLDPWKKVVSKIRRLRRQLTIALVGKYVHLQDAYKSVYESLDHGAIANGCRLGVLRVDPELLEKENVIALLKDCRGILVPGGFGNRGILGKLSAIRHARTMRIPFFGICLGMQLAVVEFARNVAGLEEAHSVEFAPETPHPVITLMDSQRNLSTKGGTMRLGHYDCQIVPETLLQKAYGDTHVLERHRHRYEFNGAYVDKLVKSGLTISGTGPHGLVEAVEIAEHPWFIGVQFHPEFQSNPHRAHPLFRSFIGAALEN
ncbi:MAG: CTP synthase [Puniceicoccales bacterium]|jgi:CTP synthase|nr:CTP synthase [Puniceicoccales bacterium]